MRRVSEEVRHGAACMPNRAVSPPDPTFSVARRPPSLPLPRSSPSSLRPITSSVYIPSCLASFPLEPPPDVRALPDVSHLCLAFPPLWLINKTSARCRRAWAPPIYHSHRWRCRSTRPPLPHSFPSISSGGDARYPLTGWTKVPSPPAPTLSPVPRGMV